MYEKSEGDRKGLHGEVFGVALILEPVILSAAKNLSWHTDSSLRSE